MTSSKIQSKFQQKYDQFNEKLSEISKKMGRISFLRLIVFLSLLVFATVLIFNSVIWVVVFSAILHICIFVWLVMIYQYYDKQKLLFNAKIDIAKHELNILKLDLTDIDSGTEYLDNHDSVPLDLDLFGVCSLFQLLNRTKTMAGRNLLVSWIQKHETDNETIKNRQQVVKELSNKSSFLEEFQTALHYSPINKEKYDIFLNWSQSTSKVFFGRLFVICMFALPSFTILSLIFYFGDLVSLTYFKCFGITQFLIWAGFSRQINKAQIILRKQFIVIDSYRKSLKVIKPLEFESLELKYIQSCFFHGKNSALTAMNQLSRLLNSFENSNNIVLNILFMYDLIIMHYLEKWKIKNKESIQGWIDGIAQMDAFVSLGGFAELNPEFCYPEISNNYILKTENLGHPLIPFRKRICNDFQIDKNKSVFVLTGANMSGKSTFLRTVGINLILAMMGAPVCATAFEFKPRKIRTSIRTNDSLHDGISYFYAELQKIKRIMDELKQGTDLFIILDEVLKGTNSADKLHGSQELLKKLVQNNVVGIIATHDLALADIVDILPNNIHNISFDMQVNNDELNFDYKLKHGVTKNMSASFLMRKMDII